MSEREQTIPGVFGGGDIANGAGTVIAAMGGRETGGKSDT
jgi:NADPH-dependent glutamate synthase beta subunit-like oxidoreductase